MLWVAYPAVMARAYLARPLAELRVFDRGRDHGQKAVRLAEAEMQAPEVAALSPRAHSLSRG